jgi:hypothetical protein
VIPGLEIPPQYGWPLLTALAIAIVGYVIQKALKNKPGAPTVTEAWEETRLVREEMNNMRAAFDVLFHLIDRTARDWNKGKPFPRLTPEEKAIVDKVRPIPEPEPDPPPSSG